MKGSNEQREELRQILVAPDGTIRAIMVGPNGVIRIIMQCRCGEVESLDHNGHCEECAKLRAEMDAGWEI